MKSFKTNKPILSVGDVCPDIILPYGDTRQVLAAIARGVTISAEQESARIMAGGSVGNTAHGIAALGGTSWFAGKVGDDYFGRFLRDEFLKIGVDTRYMILDEAIPTSMVIVVVDREKDRITYAIPRTGASQHQLNKEDLPESVLDQIGWLHTSGILLREDPAAGTILELMRKCRSKGIITSLDVNFRIEGVGNKQYMDRILQGIALSNILFGSVNDELMPITGADIPQAAARALVTSDRIVVGRSGGAGADIYLPDGSCLHGKAFEMPVIDTLGAGDAYNAGFIVAAARGSSLEEANRWGNAVAGYKIMHTGARNFPTTEQLENFIKDFSANPAEY